MPLSYLKELAEYWRDGYDWRAHEARAEQVPAVHHRDRRAERPLPARPLARAGRAAADPHPRLARLDRGVPERHRPADRPQRTWRRPGGRVPPGDPVDPRRTASPGRPREAGLGHQPGDQGVRGADAPASATTATAPRAATPARSSPRAGPAQPRPGRRRARRTGLPRSPRSTRPRWPS